MALAIGFNPCCN